MPIPPDPVLRAAVRWLERLPRSSVARCRALFTTHSEFSDITPTQYETAYTWLRSTGLLDDPNRLVRAEHRVFSTAVVNGDTAWFQDADVLVQNPDELPEDAIRAAAALGLDDAEAYAQITTVWGKVDTAVRDSIGAAGELALVDLLMAFADARVDHVAATSDGYGYDIAVHGREQAVHLEVKATTRRRRLVVYLSRNEYQTMCRDSAWRLVALRLTPDMEPIAVATIPTEWIAAEVPSDTGSCGRWESCSLEVPLNVLVPGIPILRDVLADGAPEVLVGTVEWPG